MAKNGKGNKVSSAVLTFVNLGITVLTVLVYVLGINLLKDLNASEDAAEVFAKVIVFICFGGLPILFTIVNLALAIPSLITASVGLKKTDKKELLIACIVISAVIIVTVVSLFIFLYIPNVSYIG